MPEAYALQPIGEIRSTLRALQDAPRQGSEGAPDAWLEVRPAFAAALRGIGTGEVLVVITWLHRADRAVLEVHPRSDPDVGPIEAIDGTPVVDVKVALDD